MDARLRLDALRQLWRERILTFDAHSQEQILSFLHIPEPDGQKVALVLGVCLILGMTWLTWAVRSELKPRQRDPVTRAYERLCRRLAAIGLRRHPYEGAEAFAARVSAERPDLAATVSALCPAIFRIALLELVAAKGGGNLHRGCAVLQAARFSRVFMNSISGQRSSVRPRLTRVGARYTNSPA